MEPGGHAAAYARVCGFPEKDTVPLPYPHVLAFPLHMEALTSPQFPFPAVGTLHLENAITSHRPLHPGELVDVSVRVSPPRPHPKGTAIDFVAEARPLVASADAIAERFRARGRSMNRTIDVWS